MYILEMSQTSFESMNTDDLNGVGKLLGRPFSNISQYWFITNMAVFQELLTSMGLNLFIWEDKIQIT